MGAIVPRTSARLVAFPALLQRTVKNAISGAEFFSARLSNPHTRRAYARPVANFLAWVEQQRIELISMCRKRSFATDGQGRRPARAIVYRIPCLIICLVYAERSAVRDFFMVAALL